MPSEAGMRTTQIPLIVVNVFFFPLTYHHNHFLVHPDFLHRATGPNVLCGLTDWTHGLADWAGKTF